MVKFLFSPFPKVPSRLSPAKPPVKTPSYLGEYIYAEPSQVLNSFQL